MPEPDMFEFHKSCYLHQDQLSWGRTQALIAIELATLGASYAAQSVWFISIPVLIGGTFLVGMVFLLILRDWDIRDHHAKHLAQLLARSKSKNRVDDLDFLKPPPGCLKSGSNVMVLTMTAIVGANVILAVVYGTLAATQNVAGPNAASAAAPSLPQNTAAETLPTAQP